MTQLQAGYILDCVKETLETKYIPTEVLFHNLSSQDIVFYIKKYFDENGLPIKNITLDSSIIPDELNNDLIKAQVKFKGEIWTIHKHDKDTFPSQPHAHNYDRQYKLHLGNGKLFRKKDCVGNINNKDFLNLRNLIIQSIHNINLPQYENL